jgi:hypothetical protein
MRLMTVVWIPMAMLGACSMDPVEGEEEEASTIGGRGGGGDTITMPNAAALYRTDVTLSATMTGTTGTAGQTLAFYVDSTKVGSAMTDLSGHAQLTVLLPATIHTGAHTITATTGTVAGSAALDVVKAPVNIVSAFLDATTDVGSAPASGYHVSTSPYIVSGTTPDYGIAGALTITFNGTTKSVTNAACANPDLGPCPNTAATFSVTPSMYGESMSAHIAYAGDKDHLATAIDTNALFLQAPNAAVPVYNFSIYANGAAVTSGQEQPLELTQVHELRIHVADSHGRPVSGVQVWAYALNITASTYPDDPWQNITFFFPNPSNASGDAIYMWTYDSPLLPGNFNLSPFITYKNAQYQIGHTVYQDTLDIGVTDVDSYVTVPTKPSPGQTAAVDVQLYSHVTKLPLANVMYYVVDPHGSNACGPATTNANGYGTCNVTIPGGTPAGLTPYTLGISQNDYSMQFPTGSKFWIDVL